MKKTIKSLFLAGALTFTACSAKYHARKGDRAYDQLAYLDAIEHYENARRKGLNGKEMLSRMGDSYQRVEKASSAASVYHHLVKSGNVDQHDLQYGQTLMELGNYAQATPFLQSYAEQNKDDQRAQNLVRACEITSDLQLDRGHYSLMSTNLNSETSDFGPVLYKDKLYFSSARSNEPLEFNWDRTAFLDLYEAEFRGTGKLGTPVKLPTKINSRFHEAIPAFAPDGSYMIFTRNNYSSGKARFSESSVVKLQMYEAPKKGKRWGKIQPFPYNDKEYSVGHPTLSSDGQTLYFASDMPGGSGGVDLYKCSRNGEQWGQPENLGSTVNTEGDEMFPTLDGDGTLIFSSNGHPGLGGLDLFSTQSETLEKVDHLGAPLNSKGDDFQMVIAPSGKIGFFTSNRSGGMGMDDIYAFERIPGFKGAIASKDGTPLPTALVSIQSGSGEVIHPPVGEDGTFDIGLKPGGYMVSIIQPGYAPYQEKMTIPPNAKGSSEDFVLTEQEGCDETDIRMLASTKKNGAAEGGKWIRISMKDILVQTDDEGKVQVPLPPGFEYDVVLEDATGPDGKALVSTKNLSGTQEIPVVLASSSLGVPQDTIPELEDVNFEDPFYIIYYDYNQSEIRNEDARPELDRLVRYMVRNETIKVVLTSHTDSRGKESYNLSLSKRRAQEAYAYILKQGIERERLFYNYEGERSIANECKEGVPCPDERHQQNRRTEFKLKK